jgi:hypothetical protein
MKPLLPVALLGLFAVVSCRPRATMHIPDATQPITITVAPGGERPARGFSVHVRGRIDGSALIWNSEFGTNTLSGKIDVRYRDNHSTNFTLNYEPQGVRTGEVIMDYVFY